ncbi:MAG: hypothetical protein A3C61_02940 [Candidatus Yanofskybacteria bacterium RIFCSPHIGHO2_02_FULL_39_10]|uniref:Uncharacterized protein n=1 Tax=Candidatus Yanofskybacteria bacterium RIFCSPHIGHO2_02_FULL_39_10 TaxID=1802674 RepID=A0A1F8F978_9BACT|nr:MAG: hypothetical protein A3C61_02940 [Candidatus Yanofskybacteria bacterium RIFCSPHIGHO2_02_FULL_39_10]
MQETIGKQNRVELQAEFNAAKLVRDIQRDFEKDGINISVDTIRAVIERYQKLTAEQDLIEEE